MKKLDEMMNSYDAENEELNIDEDDMSRAEKERIKKLVMLKAGLPYKKSTKKRFVIPFAAVISIIVLSFALVSANEKLLDIYNQMFGENTKYITEITNNINVSCKDNGITLNVVSMLGDENSYYMVFELIKEDKTTFENVNFIDIEDFSLKFEGSGGYTVNEVKDDNPNDNKATFVVIGSMAKNVIGNEINLSMNGITECHVETLDDVGSQTNIINKTEGKWNVKFAADYKNITNKIKVNKEAEINGKRYNVKTLKISPISVHIEMTNNIIDKTKNPVTGDLIGQVKVKLKDGTETENISGGSGGNIFRQRIDIIFSKPIDVNIIQSVVIGNIEIYVK